MKKITVFLTALAFTFFFANASFAQEQQAASDTAVTAKKRPAPIPRTHIVEDYLPILGKQARANGIRPPKPFFVSAIYYHMEIPQNITNAKGWGFYGVTEENAQPVGMYNAKVETNSVGVRAGINILPFLSVFGVYIHTDVTSKFTAVVDGIPGIMSNGYKLDQALKVKADTGAVGAAASYGFRLGRVVPFAVLMANYAWSFSNMTDKAIESLIAGARVGLNVPLPKDMKVAFTFGAQYMYMPMGNKVQGQYTVTLPAGTIDGTTEPVTITSKYRANAEYASPWTMNAGIIFSPIRYFDIITEFGFLTRFTAMVALQANF
ncbi:MAG: hypothetical protein K2N11_05485 [Mucispirillum sp.]|nr:hypothetical protein [Mucispirillum sp.]